MLLTPLDVGKQLRTARLTHARSTGLFLVPLDHSVADGPIADTEGFGRIVTGVAAGGADAILVHKGRARFLDPSTMGSLGLVVHLNASTRHAPDTDQKILVADVEDALRLGADAVSVHVNIGSDTEPEQLVELGSVAGACLQWGIPLLAMMYPRGPRIDNPREPELVAHAAGIAVDLGADMVKVPYTGSPDTMADVVASCPIPVLVAGGEPRSLAELTDYTDDIMSSGVAGVAMGRSIFQAEDVRGAVAAVAKAVHRRQVRRPDWRHERRSA